MRLKSIAIEVTENAFLPEAYAYRFFFRNNGFVCEFVQKGSRELLQYDVAILFHGFHPFWRKYPQYVVGEYHSLSTGRFSRLKDFIKRQINIKASLYVFLNEEVRTKLWYTDRVPHIIRGMGFNRSNFTRANDECENYDIVYSGSYRSGLWDALYRLADMGFKIALVGPHTQKSHNNIITFGRMAPQDAHRIMLQARIGLNYTPDIFPYNIQDSTKTIEYCAANLKIITTRYQWINKFERDRGGQFLSLEDINSAADVFKFDFLTPNVDDLAWDIILERSGLCSQIEALA